MTDVDRTFPDSSPLDDDQQQRLVSRLIDDEATDAERAWFEQRAEANPALQLELERQRRQHAQLSEALQRRITSALQVELPIESAPAPHQQVAHDGHANHRPLVTGGRGRIADDSAPGRRRSASLAWLSASVGWAAVLVLAVLLAVQHTRHRAEPGISGAPVGESPAPQRFTPEELWRAYLDAPFVQHEMRPLILHSEPLSDGGLRLRIMRRVEETYDLSPQQVAEMIADLDAITDEFEQARLDELRRAIQQQTADPDQY